VPEDLFNPPLGEPHHLAYVVEDIEVTVSLLPTNSALGHDIEIHDDVPGLRDFFAMVTGAADGWDGSEQLRPVTS